MVEDSEGDFEKADEAEWRIIQAVRQIGNKLLTSGKVVTYKNTMVLAYR